MNLNLHETWADETQLIQILAKNLVEGRLGLLLGAGVSSFYGLPDWKALVNHISKSTGEAKLTSDSDILIKANAIRVKHFKDKEHEFALVVKNALYEGVSRDFDSLRQNDLLAAIGALAMSSSRGSASNIVTLNYDDILETYLEYYGYTTSSVTASHGRHWVPNKDVVIYHPHGFLPLEEKRQDQLTNIVLGKADYLKIQSNSSQNLWRSTLLNLLRTHTFIHIGLSGDDEHLQNLIHECSEGHAIRNERTLFHSLRIISAKPNQAKSAKKNQADLITTFESWGVFTHLVTDHSETPKFLFKICQAARDLRY
jgi:hypothetical protein